MGIKTALSSQRGHFIRKVQNLETPDRTLGHQPPHFMFLELRQIASSGRLASGVKRLDGGSLAKAEKSSKSMDANPRIKIAYCEANLLSQCLYPPKIAVAMMKSLLPAWVVRAPLQLTKAATV